MKKIIAIILALSCVFAVSSCGKSTMDEASEQQLEAIFEMFDDSLPTKAVTTTTETYVNLALKNEATLITGTIDGKIVSVYSGAYEQLSDIGNTLSMKNTIKESKWYVEGQGVTTDKGTTWDTSGTNFAPTEGFIKLNIDPKVVVSSTYTAETETLVMTIAKENATDVVKEYLDKDQTIDSDLIVTIVTSGGRITNLKLEFSLPEHNVVVNETTSIPMPVANVVIDAVYSYDLQDITLE